MTKELVVGKNYGEIFGISKDKGQMIYNGGISWTAVQGDRQMVKESESTTKSALEYINRPSYKVGQ